MLKHMGPAAELATHLSFAQKYYNQGLVFVEKKWIMH